MLKNQPLVINDTEKEVLILKASIEIIDLIINNNVLKLHHNDLGSVVKFETNIHQEYFSIILVDFLSKPADFFSIGKKLKYINLLKDICSASMFNEENSIGYLDSPVSDFYNWLETEIKIKEMWFPSIDLNIDLMLTYSDFLFIGGNISKHNFTHLSGCANKMKDIFKRNNIYKEVTECLLALEDFRNWFHGDGNIFGYLSSSIAEYLNNIRWGIHSYLKPEFSRSYNPIQGGEYSYQYPKAISNSAIKAYYWDLMNDVRRDPYIPKFKVASYYKNHPLIEIVSK